MDDHGGFDGHAREAIANFAPAAEAPAGVPWLEGALLRYLSGTVLDIKAPGDPHSGPVIRGAVVASWPMDSGISSSGAGYNGIFSRDALACAADQAATLAAWFDLLCDGGHLVAIVPHADRAQEYRGPVVPRSHAIPAPPTVSGLFKGATADDMMRTVQAALPAHTFRVVQIDEAPSRRAAGGGPAAPTETRLVLQKLRRGVAMPAGFAAPATGPISEAIIPFLLTSPAPPKAPGMRAEGNLLMRDFAPPAARIERILILKLDHHGDFLIGLPALRELRDIYRQAHIRLICGRWNVAAARAAGVADDVRCFDYFPERAMEWAGAPVATDWNNFAAAVDGHFDIAIDLRVDEDTRALLGRIDADLRCGIGTQARFPLLDIALPDASRDVFSPAGRSRGAANADGSQTISPDEFISDMEIRHPAYHEAGFATGERCLLRSHNLLLPMGRFSASFDLSARRFVPGLDGVGVGVEVIANGRTKVAGRVFGRRSLRGLDAHLATVEFDSAGDRSCYQFRVILSGKPLAGRIRFAGLCLRRLDRRGARFQPSELHVGEKLSLLVSLIRQRTLPVAQHSAARVPRPNGTMRIVVAPFSNSTVRDWPAAQYATLVGLLSERFDCTIWLVGSPTQQNQAARLMSLLPPATRLDRVTDKVGKTQWADLPDILCDTDMVICNNSGIAHQAAELGVRTLAIYSASHQPLEWGPRGTRTRAIMMSVACSPCGFERVEECENDHLCMRLITPETVLAQVEQLLAGDRAAAVIG